MNPTTKSQPAQALEMPADETPLLDRVLEATVNRMDAYARRIEREIQDPATGRLRQAVVMAQAIERLRQAFGPELMGYLRSLINSPLGFLADKGKGTRKPNEDYPDDVLRDCAIEALLKGFWWTGNEFNIIAGRFMGVLNGWKRKCDEIPGITDLKVTPGMPTVRDNRVGVRVAATWRINGIADKLVGADGAPGQVFYPPQSGGSSDDNNVGKALRRAYKAVYEQATGTRTTDLDDDVEPGANGGGGSAGRAAAKLNGAEPAPPAPAEKPAAPPPRRPEDDPDLLEKMDAVRRVSEGIQAAQSEKDLQDGPGAELTKLREWLGEPACAPLLAAYQERFRGLQKQGQGGQRRARAEDV